MPVSAGNLEMLIVPALVNILSGSAALQTLFGRATDIVVPFEDVHGNDDPTKETPIPVLVYDYVEDKRIGGVRDQREVLMTLDAIAEGNDARTTLAEALAIARNALTWNAFNAQGLDAIVLVGSITIRVPEADPQAIRALQIRRMEFRIRAEAP